MGMSFLCCPGFLNSMTMIIAANRAMSAMVRFCMRNAARSPSTSRATHA